MSTIVQLNKRKDEMLARQEAIINAALEAKRTLSADENTEITNIDAQLKGVDEMIARSESTEKARTSLRQATSGVIAPAAKGKAITAAKGRELSNEYFESFYANLRNLNRIVATDVLFEGADGDSSAGGVVAPVLYDGKVIPLAPINMALRQLGNVVPTTNDFKIPVQQTKAAATKKSQSTSSGANAFNVSNPTIKLVTLGADMIGLNVPCSIEALQDIGYMQNFIQNTVALAVQEEEEAVYRTVLLDTTAGAVHFTGSLTNPEDYLSMTDQPDRYDANSSWLMPKRKAISLKKAQVAANQFNPFWVTVNGRDYFHGYPVFHSTTLQDQGSPAADAVVFGDFKAGLIIGDRNNSAILLKLDDVTDFKNGLINFFGYRRSQALVQDRNALRSSIVI